jgi:hypothetical protein
MAGAAQAELREGGGGPESPQREPEGFRPEFGQEVRDAQDSGSRGLEEPDGCAEEEDCPLEARGIGIAWEPSQISVSAAIRLEERERERGRKRDGERERKREGERGGGREYRKKLKKKKRHSPLPSQRFYFGKLSKSRQKRAQLEIYIYKIIVRKRRVKLRDFESCLTHCRVISARIKWEQREYHEDDEGGKTGLAIAQW